MSKIKLIDFSDGIRSEEIQDNFNILQDEINRERYNVGGPGIASGLEIETIVSEKEFAIKLTEASIINNDGTETHIEEQIVNIDRPKLSKELEYLNADYNNNIIVKHVPYSTNQITTVQESGLLLPEQSGIEIKYENSNAVDDYIRIRSISGKTITLSGLTRRNIKVSYNYSAKRIDTVYLDDNNNVKVISGITSTTPSVVLPNKYKYLIAFIEIDNMYINKDNGSIYANIIIKEDLRKLRNLYTDKHGVLWICGVPFDDLQIIHMVEPRNPKLNTVWYNSYTNSLMIWRPTDKLTYMNSIVNTTDYINNPELKKDYETDIDFTIGNNELSVYLNDVKLDDSQYTELLNGLPIDEQDIAKNTTSKEFRLYVNLNIGDKITYKIEYNDNHDMWVPINKTSYVNAKEVKMFGPTAEYENNNYFATEPALALGKDNDNYPYKYQYFIFDRETDMNMLFTPNKNELNLLINQIPLHFDQYEEITIFDIESNNLPSSVIDATKTHFNWDEGAISRYYGEYDNIGIGFKLKEPLDVALGHEVNGSVELFVEASVERRVNDAPFKRKLQRTATFVYEQTVNIDTNILTDNKINIIDSYYRYRENQLEIFLNGSKLIKDIDYIEGTDLDGEEDFDLYNPETMGPPVKARGAVSKQFQIINRELVNNDKLTYKIMSNIYSYDHINTLLDTLEYEVNSSTNKVNEIYDKTIFLQQNMESSINDLTKEIEEIKDIANDLDGKYLTANTILKESQMPPSVISNKVQSLDHIMFSINYISGTLNYDVKDNIRQEDFVMCLKRDVLNDYDKLLIRDLDYSIYNLNDSLDNYSTTTFSLSSDMANIMNNGDRLIFTGVKFGKAGR